MKEVVIVSGARTAIGAFGGALKSTPAMALGAIVMRATLDRVNVRASEKMFYPESATGQIVMNHFSRPDNR